MNYDEYFGKRDAEQENAIDLAKFFYRPNLLDRIKINSKSQGNCIIVGVKGSGKTAICKSIENSADKKGIVLKLERADGFQIEPSIDEVKRQSSYYESLLIVYLLSRLIEIVRKNQDSFSKEAREKLPNALKRFGDFLGSTLKQLKISAGTSGINLELDIEQLLKQNQRDLSKAKLSNFLEILEPCLKEKRGHILIDDVDEIFPGSDTNYEFIEGLIAAARAINNTFGNLLHCLVFLKAGPYSRYFEHGRNYDKHASAALIIRWDANELIEMLATRARAIALGAAPGKTDSWKDLQLVFDGNKEKIDEIGRFLISRCNSGPRDLVVLGNFSKQAAGESKITLEDIKKVDGQYSQEKINQLNRDYQRQYGNVSSLLTKVFRNHPMVYPKGNLEQLIQTEILGNAEIMESGFGSMELLAESDSSTVMEKLFDFGFVGYRENSNSDFIYMMDMQSAMVEPGDQLFDAYEHRIHPAYQSYLRLLDTSGKPKVNKVVAKAGKKKR